MIEEKQFPVQYRGMKKIVEAYKTAVISRSAYKPHK
jgi:hypothetical protein